MYHRQSLSPERLHSLDARRAATQYCAAVSVCLFIGFAFSPWTAAADPAQNGAIPATVLTARKVRPRFSASPTESEISRSGAFIEPLVPVGSDTPTAAENTALASATLSFVDRTVSSDTTALSGFLDAHPNSPWRASLLTNLGLRYRKSGYYSRALDCWEQAWNLAKSEKGVNAHNLADRALGELLELNSRVGRQERLKTLLAEVGNRNVQGSVGLQITNAKASLWLMQNHPETSFKCGPCALGCILGSQHSPVASSRLIEEFASTSKGVSLSQVAQLSGQLGMNYQMAKRQPGAEFIVPSVIHWKVGHYAALVKKIGTRYVLEDPTFGQPIQVEEAALNEEATGYFVVPAGALPAGWQSVSEDEGNSVWGRGEVGGHDPDPTCDCDHQTGDDGGGGDCAGCGEGPGPGAENIAMPGFRVHTMEVSLHLTDSPVGYTPPFGSPVYVTVTYNQLEANQPTTFQYSNFGSLWTFNWLSYVTLDGDAGSNAHIYMRGGGTHNFPMASAATSSTSTIPASNGDLQSYPPNNYDLAKLAQAASGNYEQRMPDGSKEVYNLTDAAGRTFLRQVVDAQGNAITLYYDADVYTDPQQPPQQPYRLNYISDALGQKTHFYYDLSDDLYKITRVTDPFNRTAYFGYTKVGGIYQLTSITDVIGMTSRFTYQDNNFLNSLTTPYGTTTFDATGLATNGSVRALKITDPLGAVSRWESWIQGSENGINYSDPDNLVPKGMYTRNLVLYARNTFFWSKKAMVDDPSHQYTNARIYHFLHVGPYSGYEDEGGILESVKMPLENRVWYNYPGQTFGDEPLTNTQTTEDEGATLTGSSSKPIAIGRVLDDGTTQLTQNVYSSDLTQLIQTSEPALDGSGNPIAGRTTYFDYDTNNVDLLMIRQANGGSSVVMKKFVYDSSFPPHRPQQVFDASGQSTSFTYYPNGRVHQRTDAKGTVINYDYSATVNGFTGYVASTATTDATTNATATTTYSYDGFGRWASTTDSDGYQLSFTYDALDRLIKTTYPDASTRQTIYNRLDPEWLQDRQGRWTHLFHDAQRHLVVKVDPQGQITNFGYCLCGAQVSLIDPAGNTTQWGQDIQGRQTSKTYPDGSKATITYENRTSRIWNVLDPAGQTTTYTYSIDNELISTAYTNALHATPTVSFTYDPVYDRRTTMSDGSGTTTYSYGSYPAYTTYASWPGNNATTGAGQLSGEAKVGNPGFATYAVGYGYDQLGRRTSRSIDGTNNPEVENYDGFGRITKITNPLGQFWFNYVSSTSNQIGSIYLNNPSGLRTTVAYDPNAQDKRLLTINNLAASGATISRFDYAYNPVGTISAWTQQFDNQPSQVYNLAYDGGDKLTEADLVTTAGTSAYIYGYDQAYNRTSEQINPSSVNGSTTVTNTSFNSLNQIIAQNAGGPLRFSGTVNHSSTTVTVSGNPAQVSGNKFVGYANVHVGTNTVTVSAADQNGNTATSNYQVQVNSGVSQSVAYDNNGNLTNDGLGKTYEWDAANRLTAINYTTSSARTEFSYDGANRRVQIVEKNGTTVTSTTNFVWSNEKPQPDEARNGNAVTKRFYWQGEQIGLQSYYFTRDHLGTVCELVDNSGVVHARYAYDPSGVRSSNLITTNPIEADFGFTGFYYHVPSGLQLALYRAYDANSNRWLSRDPLKEAAGTNLYAYCLDDNTNLRDLFGLDVTWAPAACKGKGETTQFIQVFTSPFGGSTVDDGTHGGGAVPGKPTGFYPLNPTYAPTFTDNPGGAARLYSFEICQVCVCKGKVTSIGPCRRYSGNDNPVFSGTPFDLGPTTSYPSPTSGFVHTVDPLYPGIIPPVVTSP